MRAMRNESSNEDHLDYQPAIHACVDNGKRLIRDAELLRDDGSYSTALAIAILAEEEFAKAFLLFLIQDQAVPSTPEVWRALRDHYCKHLLRIWMDYLDADVDDFVERVRLQYEEDELPRDVAGAVNLFRHVRVARWERPDSGELDGELYDNSLKQLPHKIDRIKQNAIYIDISANGEVLSTPSSVTEEQVRLELERCSKLQYLARQLEDGSILLQRDFDRLKEALGWVFTPPVREAEGASGEFIPGVQIYREEWRVLTLKQVNND